MCDLSNAIHNSFASAINKVSCTKLYMLDDHYECTIVHSCDIFMTILKQNWSHIYSKSLKIAYGGLGPPTPVPHWGASDSPQTPCLGRIT